MQTNERAERAAKKKAAEKKRKAAEEAEVRLSATSSNYADMGLAVTYTFVLAAASLL